LTKEALPFMCQTSIETCLKNVGAFILWKIILHSPLSNNILLDTIRDSFNDRNELKPMKHMLDLLSCWKEGATLVKESLKTKIKESSDLIIPIVGVIITILSSFFLPPPSK
jgi:hypothetical protein